MGLALAKLGRLVSAPGRKPAPPPARGVSVYNKGLAWLLWALSWLGVGGLHRFYLGRPLTGLLYLCTYNLAGLGLVIDALTLHDMVDAANLRLNHQLPEHGYGAPLGELPPAREDPTVLLVRAAGKRQGVLTVTEAVMDTGLPFAEVEAALESLLHTGYVSIDNHPDSGVVIYRFHELDRGGGAG